MEETFQSFKDLCSRAAEGLPTRVPLKLLFNDEAHRWISKKQWQERYSEAFRYFDTDNNGKLSCDEVQSAFSEWGYSVSEETLETLLQLVDSDAESDLDQDDLYLIMSALVGIRGGLHGESLVQA